MPVAIPCVLSSRFLAVHFEFIVLLLSLTAAINTPFQTAATLAFVVYFLSIYPAVLSRLREEVLSKVGPTRRPDYDDIRDMKYLRAVINGTFDRLESNDVIIYNVSLSY